MTSNRFRYGFAVSCGVVMICLATLASVQQLVPAGEQFQVNTIITGSQRSPEVAMTAEGFMVVWENTGAASGIRGQVFDLDGVPVGPEVTIGEPGDDQMGPAVAGVSGAGFLVAWDDGATDYVRGQMVGTDGNPIGDVTQLSTAAADDPRWVRAAGNPNGFFAVIWTSCPFGDNGVVKGRSTNSWGHPGGDEFVIDDNGWYDCDPASMGGYDDHNRFVVAVPWAYDVDDELRVHRVRAGNVVDSTYIWDAEDSTVAVRPDGGFVVSYGSSDYYYDYRLRGSSSDNRGLWWEETDDLVAAMASAPRGDLVIVDESEGDITAHVRTVEGVVGADVPVDMFSYQTHAPSIASIGNDFVVVWQSWGSAGSDTDGSSIQARRFTRPGIMSDGFSSGSLTAWSSAITTGCTSTRTLVCGQQFYTYDTWSNGFGGSTKVEDSYPCLESPHPGAEVAYAFTAPSTGSYTVDLLASTAILSLAVIEGSVCDPTLCIGGSQGPSPGDRSVTFSASAGQSYTIVVEARAGQYSEYLLRLLCP